MADMILEASGDIDARIGKIDTPLRMVVAHESDVQSKKDSVVKQLYNVEKSKHFAETVVTQDELGYFKGVAEGGGAPNDTYGETSKKIIEHGQLMSEMTITKMALDDSNYELTSGMRTKAENFTRSAYKTRNRLAQMALIKATGRTVTDCGVTLDLTTGDGKPLFSTEHKYGSEKLHGTGTQSNWFRYSRASDTDDLTQTMIDEALAEAVERIRTMKSENGDILGYTADTIIIPANARKLEQFIRRSLGSEHDPASANNAINTQYGNWNLIILPSWEIVKTGNIATQDFPFLVMSSEMNENLQGNMFLDRSNLDIKSWEDKHTRNYIMNGYMRFGIGFGSYKHILRFDIQGKSSTAVDATAVTL